MVHALQAQNTYIGDPTGDGTSSANWLKEGLASLFTVVIQELEVV